MMPADKRRFPRLRIHVPVRYQVRGASEFSNVLSDNISLNGLGFIHDRFIPPATKIMLEINVLLNILNPTGRVAWSAPLPHSDRYLSGVEFLEMPLEQKRYLEDFIGMQAIKA
ncbi:PilZ domain-containing protein [bacterium]|nr:MAG: PilZ domain-containing protein [bacterium]